MTNRLPSVQPLRLEGCLLVAAPGALTEDREQAVFMIVQHSPQGAVGVLLNQTLTDPVAGLWQQLTGSPGDVQRDLLHFGGPQSGPVVALHACPEFAEFETAEGVYVAAQVENLQQLVQTSLADSDLKIIVGQANWEPGQLDEEFRDGLWLPLPVTHNLVFADQNLMWHRAMREVGNHFVALMVQCQHTAEHAQLN